MYTNRFVRVWLPYIRSTLRCELQVTIARRCFRRTLHSKLSLPPHRQGHETLLVTIQQGVPFRPYYRVLSSSIRQERVARNTGEYDGVHDADRCMPAIEMDRT